MKKILPRNISSSMNAIQHPASPILRRIPSRYANKMLTPQQEITAMTIGKNTSPAPRSELSSTWLNARPISTKISIKKITPVIPMISSLCVNKCINGLWQRKIRTESTIFKLTAIFNTCWFSRYAFSYSFAPVIHPIRIAVESPSDIPVT